MLPKKRGRNVTERTPGDKIQLGQLEAKLVVQLGASSPMLYGFLLHLRIHVASTGV